MYPVHINNFKSRNEVGDDRFSECKAGIVKAKSNVDKSSRFEHKTTDSFVRSDRPPRTTVPELRRSSGPLVERSPISQQRIRTSWKRQPVIPRSKLEAALDDSSSDEPSKMPCRLHRKKFKKKKIASKSSKFSSNKDNLTRSGFQSTWTNSSKSTDSLSYDADVGSVQKSNESVNEYLASVSRKLKEEHLLGKLDLSCVAGEGKGYRRRATNDKLNALTTNFMYVAEGLKQKRVMDFRNAIKKEGAEAVMVDKNRMINVDGVTFWSRMRSVFSMACWRGYTSQMTSEDEDAGTDEGSQNSKLASNSSVSTETNTVIPANHVHRHGQPHHCPNPTESQMSLMTCKNEKFLATKLVESLRRFFSMSSSTDDFSDQLLKSRKESFEGITEENGSRFSGDSSDSSIGCAGSDYQSLSRKPSSAADPSISTSDYEVVEINPKQRQPI